VGLLNVNNELLDLGPRYITVLLIFNQPASINSYKLIEYYLTIFCVSYSSVTWVL